MRDIGAIAQAALQWVMTIVGALLAALSVIAIVFTSVLLRTAHKRGELAPKVEAIGLGAVTNFFDTLGIGSFAPTTAYMKLRKMAPDSYFPAILNAGHALPTVAQALIFISLVQVDPVLLISCIAASCVGAFVGAPIVEKSPVRLVQGVVGVALLIAAALYAMSNLHLMPVGGEALSLPPAYFAVAVVGHFLMGALMMFGIGLYAPSLVLLSLLGLNPAAAFPIMMGSCAFLMPASSLKLVRSERIDLRIVLGMALGGIPAVLLAAFVVKSLDLVTLRWLVVVVVIYASILLLRSALTAKPNVQDAGSAKNP
ncbi:MAG: TSUP family transporter [Hyphomonadaceae bacterium]|nr:TSUP family transporter [Hyphomonadaceae bacterium]